MRNGLAGATLWLWRLWMLLWAALCVVQPVLAGSYLSGSYDAIRWHGIVGGTLALGPMVGVVLAVAHAVARRAVLWPALVVVLLFVATLVQITVGYSRSLAVHVPLGVAIVGVVLALAVLTWTPVVRRPGLLGGRR